MHDVTLYRRVLRQARPYWPHVVGVFALARGFLWDPRWGWHAAQELGAAPRIPPQYLRARPAAHADVFGERRQSRA